MRFVPPEQVVPAQMGRDLAGKDDFFVVCLASYNSPKARFVTNKLYLSK